MRKLDLLATLSAALCVLFGTAASTATNEAVQHPERQTAIFSAG